MATHTIRSLTQLGGKSARQFTRITDMNGQIHQAGRHFAVSRLLRDLKELLGCPLQGIAVMPLENNVYVWHGNVEWHASTAGAQEATLVHFALCFPNNYPQEAPKIYLFSPLPHLNVKPSVPTVRMPEGGFWTLAIWDCVPGEDAWRSAYTVRSVLLEVQATILDEELQAGFAQERVEAAINSCRQVEVKVCGHTPTNPFPALPSLQELAEAAQRVTSLAVARPELKKPIKKPANKPAVEFVPAAPAGKSAWSMPLVILERKEEAAADTQQQWTEVKHKHTPKSSGAASVEGSAKQATLKPSPPLPPKSTHKSTSSTSSNAYRLLSIEEPPSNEASSSTIAPKAAPSPPQNPHTAAQPPKAPAPKSVTQLIKETIASVRESQGQADGATHHATMSHPAVQGSLGVGFDLLPLDTLNDIIVQLRPRDLAALSATCRGFRSIVEAGEAWQAVLRRDYPSSNVTAQSARDWKHAYLLQATHTLGALQCFFTKASFNEKVLGLPLVTTLNPKTGTVDYCDLLCPEYKSGMGRAAPPEAWLQALPKLMNTAVVLLMDKGIAASERALATYCSLHRLFLAIADHHSLHSRAANMLTRFMTQPDARLKAQTPNLGWFIPLMALAPDDDSSQLSQRLTWTEEPEGKEGRPAGSTLEQVAYCHDLLYSSPGPGMQQRMQGIIREILAMDSWQDFLRMVGLKLPGDVSVAMTQQLRYSWHRSIAKRYHREGMDFSRIQASGVSTILLKGERYSAPPNMQYMELLDRWHWTESQGTVFLDASCLLYAKEGRLIEAVDFNHERSAGTMQQGAVSHSGDILDYDACTGTHTISVNLRALGPHVVEMVLVMSAWADARLHDCRQPYVAIRDPSTGVSLCEYHLEDRKQEMVGKKSVGMCRVYRSKTKSDAWEVQAVGKVLPDGSAGNYGPIQLWIAQQGAWPAPASRILQVPDISTRAGQPSWQADSSRSYTSSR
ncbi:hypothetical protein WJX73_007334 [Symbiochloris irregularis]|uniref:UBC core domain-containing protein n=1 Tax=Symbiochloris irregularis TaxID=706552 RepID=A0AAW1P2Y9_9CHLO